MEPDVMRALEDAWKRVGPRLLADPIELAARKARRRLDFMSRPARAWCLAVRACDSRITPMRFIFSPQRPIVWDAENHRKVYLEHKVTLEKRDLVWLCRPVTIPFPGLMADEAAQLLGVDPTTILRAHKRGLFSVRYIRGLAGKPGPPVPVVSTRRLLDPAGIPIGEMPAPEWGALWRFASDYIPHGLSQTILRRPVFRPLRGQRVYRGWRWVCPACKVLARRIYCPIPHVVASFVPRDPPDSPDRLESFPSVFACRACLNIKNCSRSHLAHWGELVSRLSGGLLFGHEVPPPKWWSVIRKRKPFTKPNARPSRLLPQIEKLLVETNLPRSQIAQFLGISANSLCRHVGTLYLRRRVHSREELRRAVGVKREMRAAG